MSFNIFASGIAGTKKNPTHFSYLKDNQIDDETFDLPDLVLKIKSMSTPKGFAKGVAEDAKDAALPFFKMPSVLEGVKQLGRMESLHVLDYTITLLAMRSGLTGHILLTCLERHTLWADTSRLARHTFTSTGVGPGVAFIETIAPALKDTNMDNFGVLLSLSYVLYAYEKKLGSDSPGINLTIELTKN